MDYWPVQGSLPVVSFNYSLPSGPAALEARIALASPLVTPLAGPRVTAAPAMAAPLPVLAEVPVVTVPDEEPVAPPTVTAPTPTASPEPTAALPAADPIQIQATMASIDVATQTAAEPMAEPKFSHTEGDVPPSTNVVQKAGGHVLNAGFAVGTGVAKSLSAFGTAFGNIGKLFFNK
jgi:outer membrane biosynthesis protein TonB